MDERLTPRERIRKKKDFLDPYTGQAAVTEDAIFISFITPTRSGSPRMAVVVSRKVGNAVTRNRIKRRIRALFRRNKALFTKPMDIILIARKEILDLSWPELAARYRPAIDRIFRERPA